MGGILLFALCAVFVVSTASAEDHPELRCAPDEVKGGQLSGECYVVWGDQKHETRWEIGEVEETSNKGSFSIPADRTLVRVRAYIYADGELRRHEFFICWDGDLLAHRAPGQELFAITRSKEVISSYDGPCFRE